MNVPGANSEERLARLHAPGVIDLHFDLLMDLYEKRNRSDVLAEEFLEEFKEGGLSVIGAAIYLEDQYVPEMALRVALDQIARLYAEVERSEAFVICKTNLEIARAREAGKIAFLITMEGAEPLGTDLNLLRVFFELGVRSIGLTHARRNFAGNGGIFEAAGSSRDGLTHFGRDVVRGCEELGIMVDLAHINPAGFDDIFAQTKKPVIVSHSNPRRFHDIERNLSDDQIKMVGERRGVIGVNSVLLSPRAEQATLDHYVDHIEHIAELIGIDCVGIGFDFFEFLYRNWSEADKRALETKFTRPHFPPDLLNHSHARNLTRKLMERGFTDEQIEKVLRGNWLRIFAELL